MSKQPNGSKSSAGGAGNSRAGGAKGAPERLDRQARLAAALRDNLRRRKAQARGRDDSGGGGAEPEGGG